MKIGKLAIYNFGVFLVLFLICELAFKVFARDYKYYERTYVGQFENCGAKNEIDTNWVKLDSTLGWVCKNRVNLKFYRPELHDIQYQINRQGFRNSVDFDTLKPSNSKKRILLLGDSFLFSILQKEENTISSILQKSLGREYEVFNLAIPGWGLDQMYLAYKKYVEIIKPEQVILLYIDDDVSRLAEAMYWGAGPKPAFKIEKDVLKERELNEGKLNLIEGYFLFNCQIFNRLYRYFCEQKGKPIAKKIIKEWANVERTFNRNLSVVHCPRFFQLSGKRAKGHFYIDPVFEDNSIPFYNLRDSMIELSEAEQKELYHLEDGHPSDHGAKFIADFILKKVID